MNSYVKRTINDVSLINILPSAQPAARILLWRDIFFFRVQEIHHVLTPFSLSLKRNRTVPRLVTLMACVKRAIALTIERTAKEFEVRLTTDTEILRELLCRLDQDRGSEFCGELLSALRTCFSSVHRSRIEVAKYNALKRFHALRLSQLPSLWTALLADMSMSSICPLLLQSVNRRVFESLMVEYFTDALMVATSHSIVVPVQWQQA